MNKCQQMGHQLVNHYHLKVIDIFSKLIMKNLRLSSSNHILPKSIQKNKLKWIIYLIYFIIQTWNNQFQDLNSNQIQTYSLYNQKYEIKLDKLIIPNAEFQGILIFLDSEVQQLDSIITIDLRFTATQNCIILIGFSKKQIKSLKSREEFQYQKWVKSEEYLIKEPFEPQIFPISGALQTNYYIYYIVTNVDYSENAQIIQSEEQKFIIPQTYLGEYVWVYIVSIVGGVFLIALIGGYVIYKKRQKEKIMQKQKEEEESKQNIKLDELINEKDIQSQQNQQMNMRNEEQVKMKSPGFESPKTNNNKLRIQNNGSTQVISNKKAIEQYLKDNEIKVDGEIDQVIDI